jgi:hypothetical protein
MVLTLSMFVLRTGAHAEESLVSRGSGKPSSIEAHRRNSSLLTHRWREMDSNLRSPRSAAPLRIAAAVQDQLRFASQQAGGVDVQREVAPDSLGGIALDHALGIRTRPQALHSRHPMSMTA